MPRIERETKLSISSDDYRSLLERESVLERIDQLNVYYHDPDQVGSGAGYLRIRFQGGRDTVATLKIMVRWSGDRREMLEVERPLDELGPTLFPRPPRRISVVRDLPAEFGEHFLAGGVEEIWRLGWLRNLRCMLELGSGGVVEVDRTRFPDGSIRYEVEIEEEDDAKAEQLVQQVRCLAPSARNSSMGKFSRFLEWWRGSP